MNNDVYDGFYDQPKVEPIPPFTLPVCEGLNEEDSPTVQLSAVVKWILVVLDGFVDHYNTHVVARLNTPSALVADSAKCKAYLNTLQKKDA